MNSEVQIKCNCNVRKEVIAEEMSELGSMLFDLHERVDALCEKTKDRRRQQQELLNAWAAETDRARDKIRTALSELMNRITEIEKGER